MLHRRVLSEIAYEPRGRTVHGASVGIVMLDTRFQRLPGDIGNAHTFSFPVQYAVAKGIRNGAELKPDQPGVLDAFVNAANDLVAIGVEGISTSCGFLSLFHPYLVERIPVPVATSSLLQIPLVQSLLPKGKRVGVLTALATALTPQHFTAVGAPADTPFTSPHPDSIMRRNSIHGKPIVDYYEQEADVLEAAGRLLDQNPSVGAIVSECTNFPPYSYAIEKKYGVPVYDVIGLINWFQRGLKPRHYFV